MALAIEVVTAAQVDKAASLFARDGFVVIGDALTPTQLALARQGAKRVVTEQTEAIPFDQANRGYARYSFGSQIHHPEWAQLIDLPTILPVIQAIFADEDFTCSGAGGDYSLPGAKIQHLHADLGDFFKDPLSQVTSADVPAPFIVANFPMVDFTKANGATRFVPGTQRRRYPPPSLEDESQDMRQGIACAPAGSAIIRDVRCWHGGTANTSTQTRIMTSVGYFAPWFRRSNPSDVLPLNLYRTLSTTAQKLCRYLVSPD
jgi:ectoine hydroxylase-related dioxygenase (phytanoyl-CoA dioxygenase family)